MSLLLSHWYPGSGLVLDCIVSGYFHTFLLSSALQQKVGMNVLKKSMSENFSSDFGCKTVGIEWLFQIRITKKELLTRLLSLHFNKKVQTEFGKFGKNSKKAGMICVKR